MVFFSSASLESMSARLTTGTPSRTAAASSGLSGFMAELTTTISGEPSAPAEWPTEILAPSLASAPVISEPLASEPETR
jgi:hypothetical protein